MADQDKPLTLAFSITVGDQVAGVQEFEQEMVTIGKGAAAVLQIEDPALADLHAAVQLGDDDTVTLLDLGSESGTLLNGSPVNNEVVKDGDQIRIGNTLLVLGLRRPEALPAAAPVSAAAEPEVGAAAPEEESGPQQEEPHEDVLEFVLRSGTAESDIGIDRQAPRILEIAQIWSGTVQSVQHFGGETKAVYIGDRYVKPLRIAGGSLVALLVVGSAFYMMRHSTLPAPPLYPELPAELAQSLSSRAGKEIKTDREAITYWEEIATAEKAALAEEKRAAREAEKREIEAEADRRIAEKPAVYDGKAREKLAAEKENDPATTRTVEDFRKSVRDDLIEELTGEREKAKEDEAAKLAPPDGYLEYKNSWTETTKTAFNKAVERNTDLSVALVPPQFELYERPDYEDFIEQKMIPVAAILAPKGGLSASYLDEFERFDKEYVRFDDLDEKRVVVDLVLGTRIKRAEAPDEVLMLVAGFDAEKTYALKADGTEIVIPQTEQVFVWDPSPAQVEARAALYHRIQELLYVNAGAKGQTGARCEAITNLLGFPEDKDDFTYNAQYARCLVNKSEFEKAREYVDRALDNKPSDLSGENGTNYLIAMEVKARLVKRDAFGGDPLLHGSELLPTDKRIEAQRIHYELRDWILQNRPEAGALKTIDTGIYQLALEELKEDQSNQVGHAFFLAVLVAFLLPFGFAIDEVRSRKMAQHFFVGAESLPSNHFPIAEQQAGALLVNFTRDSVGFLERSGEKTSTSDLLQSGRAKDVGGYFQVELQDDERFHNDIGHVAFFIHRVFRPKLAATSPLKDVDWLFIGILVGLLFVGGTFGAVLATRPYAAGQEVITIPDRFVELMVQQVEKEKEKKQKPSGNPDAGEGAKAKGEEGTVGRRDAKLKKAKGSKVAIQKSQFDKQVAESTGLLADLNQMSDSSIFGMGGLDNSVSSALGGLIGSQYGTQYGSGGLGSRGSGYGGGGTAAGLGGLGTRGSGLGASGYGRGAGFYGQKGGGGPGVGAGDPIILGALDKSLIDRVVKSHLPQIRYCYERELAKNPKLFGKIVIKFVIGKDGSVSSASTKSTTMNNPIVEQCVNERFLRMRFPAPKGGGIVIVSYPFVFNAAGG